MDQGLRQHHGVDGEGFPQGVAARAGTPGRDKESGEVALAQIITLRKPPQHKRRQQRTTFLDRQKNISKKEMHSYIRNGYLRLRENSLLFQGIPNTLFWPPLQMCVLLENGVEKDRFLRPVKRDLLEGMVSLRGDPPRSSVFRVPPASLPDYEPATRDPRAIYINSWEEFMFGKAALNPYLSHEEKMSNGVTISVKTFLESYVSTPVVDTLVVSFFLTLIFISLFIYNIYWELVYYVLFLDHLSIHDKADKLKFDVRFTGTAFQGPMYIMMRAFCRHCVYNDDCKVVMAQMKKMKVDVLKRSRQKTPMK